MQNRKIWKIVNKVFSHAANFLDLKEACKRNILSFRELTFAFLDSCTFNRLAFHVLSHENFYRECDEQSAALAALMSCEWNVGVAECFSLFYGNKRMLLHVFNASHFICDRLECNNVNDEHFYLFDDSMSR